MDTKPRRKSLRKTPLTRAIVLERAVRLADADGIASLSMRKLARALRVEAMSLYNHVSNKDDLLDGIVDLVIGEIEVPTIGGDWKRAMGDRAVSTHQVLLRHPWATMLIMSRINVGPNMLRYIDATLGCLFDAGFSYELADHSWNAMDSYIYGFTQQRVSSPIAKSAHVKTAKDYLHLLPESEYPHLFALTARLLRGEHNVTKALMFGFDLLLNGLEQLRDEEG